MSSTRQSDAFKYNFLCLKIFGLWSGSMSLKKYKYYSALFLLINFVSYDILLTLNLIYTPRKVEYLIREVIFYFEEIAVAAKVLMILRMRKQFFQVFNILDSDFFAGDDDVSQKIVSKNIFLYKWFYKISAIVSHFAFTSSVFFPFFRYLIFGVSLELPICKYYFLEEATISQHLIFWFLYQSFGMYSHMHYNINVDSLIAGLMFLVLTQLKVLNYKIRSLKVSKQEVEAGQEKSRLRKILEHYNLILEYSAKLQHILSLTMFIQFGIASSIICVVLYGLTLPSSTGMLIFMITYLLILTMQIFVPGWLGTQILHESQELVLAAYHCDWIPRSESFKRNILILTQRANVPIELTGLKIFPLSLDTFTSIMKMAYSLFTLVRNVEVKQNEG